MLTPVPREPPKKRRGTHKSNSQEGESGKSIAPDAKWSTIEQAIQISITANEGERASALQLSETTGSALDN
jgi:hypothetical protein